MKKLIVITGPTASGKTELSVQIAKKLQAEIVSCDSRQFYKELSLGTAKPTIDEMNGVIHHFINSHSVTQEINAGEFERIALPVINTIFETQDYAILCGGSGLFIDAITRGFDDMPKIKSEVREALRETFRVEGIASLQIKLQELDPNYYSTMDSDNPQRLIRALEVCLSSDKKYSELRKGQKDNRPFEVIKFVIDRPREELYKRINARVDDMFASGLINEVKSVIQHRNLTSLKTVGYTEVFEYLDGTITLEKSIELIKRNSRRYAKRQLTWFRRDPSYHWMARNQTQEILAQIDS
ncbi:MAG: tRNA dimethylallyltransferase [Salibacteraceae bacterium]